MVPRVVGITWRFARLVTGVAVGVSAVACAPRAPLHTVRIPKPTPDVTLVAPGLDIPQAAIQSIPFTISSTNPLPQSVSASLLARDVLIDNAIENRAVETGRAGYLRYADEGALLASERAEIASDAQNKIEVLSIVDRFSSVTLGVKTDPNNPSASLSALLTGTEIRTEQTGNKPMRRSITTFQDFFWLLWDAARGRYLLCDRS